MIQVLMVSEAINALLWLSSPLCAAKQYAATETALHRLFDNLQQQENLSPETHSSGMPAWQTAYVQQVTSTC